MTPRRKGQLLVALQFAILFAIVLTHSANRFAWGQAVGTVGSMLFIAGGAMVIFSFRALGPSLTANPVPLETGELVTTGMYSRVRHPIYAGLLVMTLGMVLSSSSWLRGVEWLMLLALLLYKVRFEESLLVAKYPGYAAYMEKVPALLPRR